ncbi:hypothetical protein OTK49_01865 [Vibrio coralliirubri]|uniref:hypothetical protein n=1 Tax=Vibrio coralliirubri TaxID=1516159 RepID=UPI00228511B1|nr:hypothetical protein [Vibrio coralliirubri]MCY9861260.1 hypothetical protein [Vibrio coralliirubri]
MKKIISLCLAVCVLEVSAAEISVNPMFTNISGGGASTITIINNTDLEKEIWLSVLDRTMLRSPVCSVDGGVGKIQLGANEAKNVKVTCKKNRLKELHFVQVDYSAFQLRELRRVVIH